MDKDSKGQKFGGLWQRAAVCSGRRQPRIEIRIVFVICDPLSQNDR